MEPQLPSPSSSPETGPVQSHEQLAPLRAPERAPVPSGGEKQAPREQQPSGPSDPAATQQPVAAPPLPQLNQQPASAQSVQVQDDTTPAVAADEDLIEKEWVEKAKKVIAETKHDPHLQEQAVSQLQADYLKKRYGKIVKLPSDG
jgi:hypothetical protein